MEWQVAAIQGQVADSCLFGEICSRGAASSALVRKDALSARKVKNGQDSQIARGLFAIEVLM